MILIKALVLAAGYATRLYPLTKNTPKPLIKIARKQIINYIIDEINKIENISKIYVVTNARFYSHFQKWSKTLTTEKEIQIVNDHTLSNEDRLGSIGDIHFVLQQERIDDDLLVIAGDNLFGFSLQNLIHSFNSQNRQSLVAFRDLKDKEKVKNRFGVGIVKNNQVIDFEEKPSEPKSALAATACYLFNQKDLQRIQTFIHEEKADAPGHFIKYLVKNSEVRAFVFDEHWFDVGTFESLREAEDWYSP